MSDPDVPGDRSTSTQRNIVGTQPNRSQVKPAQKKIFQNYLIQLSHKKKERLVLKYGANMVVSNVSQDAKGELIVKVSFLRLLICNTFHSLKCLSSTYFTK